MRSSTRVYFAFENTFKIPFFWKKSGSTVCVMGMAWHKNRFPGSANQDVYLFPREYTVSGKDALLLLYHCTLCRDMYSSILLTFILVSHSLERCANSDLCIQITILVQIVTLTSVEETCRSMSELAIILHNLVFTPRFCQVANSYLGCCLLFASFLISLSSVETGRQTTPITNMDWFLPVSTRYVVSSLVLADLAAISSSLWRRLDEAWWGLVIKKNCYLSTKILNVSLFWKHLFTIFCLSVHSGKV